MSELYQEDLQTEDSMEDITDIDYSTDDLCFDNTGDFPIPGSESHSDHHADG